MIVLIRLKDSTELVSYLTDTIEGHLIVEYPFEVSYIPSYDEEDPTSSYSETTLLTPWMRLSEDRVFAISQEEISIIKPASKRAIKRYTELVEAVSKAASRSEESQLGGEQTLVEGNNTLN